MMDIMMRERDQQHPAAAERGIALLIVLIVFMLTAVLALEIKATAALHMRLARNKRDDFLMRQAIRGQLEILKQVLLYDKSENDVEALDDRWTDDKYTQFQKGPEEEEERDPEMPVSSEEVELNARIEDEARKFNLHNLVADDEAVRAHWDEIFLRLLTIYREDDGPLAINRSEAEDLLRNLREWLERKDGTNNIPVPATGDEKRILVTPDELLMVKGFTREMFFDQQPEEEDKPAVPGLYHYLTLWSVGPVNLNTAEETMVYAMFEDQDRDLADRLIEWRQTAAEEQDENAPTDADPKNNALTGVQDLLQIDGFDAETVQRNLLTPITVTGSGDTFSIHLRAKATEGLSRQERWVVRRNAKGFTTILAEERNDPTFDGSEEEEE
jgi:type II secretory pathway component PulK